MGAWIKKNAWWILLLLFIIYAAKSPDPAAEFIRKAAGFIGLLFKGIGVILKTLIDLLPS